MLPAPVAPQPVAFSHRLHAGDLGLECLDCHAGAKADDFATLPAPGRCMSCHATVRPESAEVAKIAAAARDGQALPWVRVYQVPDFVFFSHREHVGKGETCATCHGPVETREVLQKEISTGMNACSAATARGARPLAAPRATCSANRALARVGQSTIAW